MAQTDARPPATTPDWTVQATDHIEAVIGAVRDKTTVPATTLARALVFGFVAAAMGLGAVVLLFVAVIRLNVYLPFHPEARRVWVLDGALGAIFLAIGGFLWRQRRPKEKR